MAIANTTIRLKRSAVSGNVPSSLDSGEIAINTADGLLFYKDPTSVIRSISTGSKTNSFSTINVSSTLLFATSNVSVLSISGNGAISVTGDPINDIITINVNDGTTSQKGVVRLYDGVNSNSTVLAATANSVNAAYSLANAAYTLGQSVGSFLTTNYKIQEYVAAANQVSFIVTDGYQKNRIAVYINGLLLDSTDYVADSGSVVVLNTPANLGDNVSIAKWLFDNSIYLTAQQTFDEVIATNNQTLFITSKTYNPGFIKVFRNGILLESSEFSANNGANVTLTHAVSNNDIITLNYWGANYIDATPVFITANNAWNAANAVYNLANNASTTANTAYALSNSVYSVANSALAATATKISNLQFANLNSISVTTSTNTSNQILDSFSTTTYRSIKYLIQVTSSTNYQTSEIILVQDGTNAYITEYGIVTTSGSLMTYDANISGGMVQLLMNPVNNINTINLVKTSVLL